MQSEVEIVNELRAKFGDGVLPDTPFPKPYCTDMAKVKAIYLGCDPSNNYSQKLPYAFALESGLSIFNNFLKDHTSNLNEVGLNWTSVYVQNLCRNYFKDETSNNLPLWKKAAQYWISHLKEELSVFSPEIPVLLTSAYLYDVLVNGIKHKPAAYYSCEQAIPIPPASNHLNRPLIPFYRNRRPTDYHLSNPMWGNYKERIKIATTLRTFADKVIQFNSELSFRGNLPDGIGIMNPFRDNPEVMPVVRAFYKKYYDDNLSRRIILGINPGRFGAGLTGIPFTDPKRLRSRCGIEIDKEAHEPSSVFVYEVIDAYGGVEEFYRDFYINSVCPLGFTQILENGKEVNYNYYDSKKLIIAAKDFIIQSIRGQLDFGIETDICYCLGSGKNMRFLKKINAECGFFKRIVALEHPRYITNYKRDNKQEFINKYLRELKNV